MPTEASGVMPTEASGDGVTSFTDMMGTTVGDKLPPEELLMKSDQATDGMGLTTDPTSTGILQTLSTIATCMYGTINTGFSKIFIHVAYLTCTYSSIMIKLYSF